MKSGLQDLRKSLRRKRVRWTAQRELIAREVLNTRDHFDMDGLIERLRKKGRVSRATVYRTMPHLQDCGLIREVFRCQGRAHYEVAGGHHGHMLCVRCGKIIEFRDKEIEMLQEKACKRHGFKPLERRVGVRGICKECRQSAVTKEK